MTLYGLRLLVALLTFAFGVAAAWLVHPRTSNRSECRVVLSRESIAQDSAPRPPCPTKNITPAKPVIAGGILQGRAVSKPQPAYPPDAKAAGVSGTVVVQVVVGEDGGVVEAEAVSGPELLRDAAVEAASRARFSPTRLSGEPVRVSGVITYRFVLD